MASSQTTATSLSTQILSLEPIKPPFGDGIIIVVICALLAVVLAAVFVGTGTAFVEPDPHQRRRQFALTACFSAFFLAAALVLKVVAAPDAALGYIGWVLVGGVSGTTLLAGTSWLILSATQRTSGHR